MPTMSQAQERAILHGFLDIDRRLAEMEALLAYNPTSSPFSRHANDLSPGQVELLKTFFAQLRGTMLACLQKCGISPDIPQTSLEWMIHTHLLALEVAVADLGPAKLRGYGPLNPSARTEVLEIQKSLLQLIARANADFQAASKS